MLIRKRSTRSGLSGDVRPLWQSIPNHESTHSTLAESAVPWRAASQSRPQTQGPAFVGVPSGATAILQTDSGPRHHARRPARLESAEPPLLPRDRRVLRDVAGQVRAAADRVLRARQPT